MDLINNYTNEESVKERDATVAVLNNNKRELSHDLLVKYNLPHDDYDIITNIDYFYSLKLKEYIL